MGTTALIVGANLPDIDALTYFAGPQVDLEWRRGWSHGVLALVVLPLLLTGVLLLLHRWRRRIRHTSIPVSPKDILLLSFVSILSHPILDTLNTYGMRWLMPFSGQWFYGDSLFIVDPWVWLVLALGVYLSRRREMTAHPQAGRPALLALMSFALYAAAMGVSGRAAKKIIVSELQPSSRTRIERVMVGPAPINPLVRDFVVAYEGEYRTGRFRWLHSPRVTAEELQSFPRDYPSHPAFETAIRTLPARRFLGWARFPTFQIEPVSSEKYLVHFIDLRYARAPGDGFAAISVAVAARRSSNRNRENPITRNAPHSESTLLLRTPR